MEAFFCNVYYSSLLYNQAVKKIRIEEFDPELAHVAAQEYAKINQEAYGYNMTREAFNESEWKIEVLEKENFVVIERETKYVVS